MRSRKIASLPSDAFAFRNAGDADAGANGGAVRNAAAPVGPLMDGLLSDGGTVTVGDCDAPRGMVTDAPPDVDGLFSAQDGAVWPPTPAKHATVNSFQARLGQPTRRVSILPVTPDGRHYAQGHGFCSAKASLMGGKPEAHDRSLEDTASREASEEMGGFIEQEIIRDALLRDDARKAVTTTVKLWADKKPSDLLVVVMDLEAMEKIKVALEAWKTTRRGGDGAHFHEMQSLKIAAVTDVSPSACPEWWDEDFSTFFVRDVMPALGAKTPRVVAVRDVVVPTEPRRPTELTRYQCIVNDFVPMGESKPLPVAALRPLPDDAGNLRSKLWWRVKTEEFLTPGAVYICIQRDAASPPVPAEEQDVLPVAWEEATIQLQTVKPGAARKAGADIHFSGEQGKRVAPIGLRRECFHFSLGVGVLEALRRSDGDKVIVDVVKADCCMHVQGAAPHDDFVLVRNPRHSADARVKWMPRHRADRCGHGMGMPDVEPARPVNGARAPPCRFFRQGRCTRTACKFTHEATEATPSL